MDKFYTSEKNVQILIALMKFHGVKKVVASPGTTNLALIGSIQQDPYFEIYSSVDERSAAYIACGMARESGEPVALSCTGATASRNYVPGLTEAFYSNLPVLAITSTQHVGRVGQLVPQVLDRSNPMNDISKKSVTIQTTHTSEDEWAAGVAINDVLLELRRHGGGPAHINLVTTYSRDYSCKELPKVKGILRYFCKDNIPALVNKRIMIIVGAHVRWTDELVDAVDVFCENYNAVVVGEHISNYRGKYGVHTALLIMQQGINTELFEPDVLIHIGTVAGFGSGAMIKAKEVWRVHPDGEIRDTWRKLTKVFEMEEVEFFQKYNVISNDEKKNMNYYEELSLAYDKLSGKIPELPFSNPWIAMQSIPYLPAHCELHLGILNSLRSWSLFAIDRNKEIDVYSNTGGFGIDGMVSALLGSSLVCPDKIYIGVIGDLAFFYDMNALGNRHVGRNIRLMVVNNGKGTEFTNYNHPASNFGKDAEPYMAAAGHYGNKSPMLVRHYAEDLGFEYMSASTKEEYMQHIETFFGDKLTDKPMLFEVFTNSEEESAALETLFHMDVSLKATTKSMIVNALGEKGVERVKKILKR